MGMFDYVKHTAPCMHCGTELTEWQTKSGPCMLEIIETWQAKDMYAPCPKCKKWNEYDIEADVEVTVKKLIITPRKDFKDS